MPLSQIVTPGSIGAVAVDQGHNAVGSFVFATRSTAGTVVAGSTYAGSGLYPAALYPMDGSGNTTGSNNGTALSGTWRALGAAVGSQINGTLFQRIA